MNAAEASNRSVNGHSAGAVAEVVPPSDAELVRAIMAHDQDAFTALMRRFNRLL